MTDATRSPHDREANASKSSTASVTKPPYRKRRIPTWFWFTLPVCIVFFVFALAPVIEVAVLSLLNWNMVSPTAEFVGLKYYKDLVTDPSFWILLWQTCEYIALALLGNFVAPVIVAGVTLSLGKRLSKIYQVLYFVPTVVATSIAALLWMWLYLPIGGALNEILGIIGVGPKDWLTDSHLVLPAVATVSIWKFFGFNYLIAIAGIVSVPSSYVEAALVDGAGWWAKWRHIMLPTMAPTLLFLGITTAVQALNNAFVPIQIMTQGGPSGRSNNILYSVYEQSFQFFKLGNAGAQAVVLMILLGGLAIWQFRMMDRRARADA